jgi:hypothetical protein
MVHVAVAAVASAVFLFLAALYTAGSVELNPVSHNLLGMAHTR